jgi:ribosomal protein S18 acetylase RimI-like enzyme
MTDLSRATYLRPCTPADDAFLHDVFCTTWESEVAALPNQNLARHVLRIQHIAQERRFGLRYPGHQRFVVMEDGERAGRLYVHQRDGVLHVIDLTLLPEVRSHGIGTRILRDVCAVASNDGLTISLGVDRANTRAAQLYTELGFRLTAVDDLENHFEWTATAPNEYELDQYDEADSARLPFSNADYR